LGAIIAMALSAHAAGIVGTAASCTEAALDAALAGGGAVTFDCGAVAHTLVLTAMKPLGQPTSIDGGGLITLDGNLTVTHFTTTVPSTLTLTLTLTDVTLADNVATGRGGAIFAHSGVAMHLTRVRASGNRADYGGVVYNHTTADTITLNQFVATGKHPGRGGGAIMHSGSSLTIADSLFAANTVETALNAAGGQGGAIWINPETNSSLAITNRRYQTDLFCRKFGL
jgi:predicted outer membrane repeat protein